MKDKLQDNKNKKTSLKNDIIFLLFKIFIFIAIFVVIFFFIFGIARSGDQAMYPSIKDGDVAVYYRLQNNFVAGDVVVVKKGDTTEIRRIVAVPFDTVDITEDGLKINGYLQQESGIYAETLPYVEGIKFPLKLGANEYFVLADKRTNTMDSRIYGAVYKNEIKGSVITLIRRRGI